MAKKDKKQVVIETPAAEVNKKRPTFRTDTEILAAIQEKADASYLIQKLGITRGTLAARIGAIQAREKRFIEVAGLYDSETPSGAGKGAYKKNPTVIRTGYLSLSPAWTESLRESGKMNVGDEYSVTFSDDGSEITLRRVKSGKTETPAEVPTA